MTKDIQWIKGKIKGFQTGENMFTDEFNAGVQDALEYVQELINQLDEPEVLSQAWIDESVLTGYPYEEYQVVPAEVLQNLLVPKQEITKEQAYDKIAESFPATGKEIESVLEKYYSNMLIEFSEEMHESIMRAFDVETTSKTIEALTGMTLEQIAEEARNGGIVPKQELPVIPNYVAKWISKHHERFDLYPALKRLENNALSWEDVYEWYRRNTFIFVNAYLTGKYEVEEQKYRVLDGNTTLLGRINGLMLTTVEILEYYPEYAPTFDFTEQEIKDYDERFWPFAVKVEELEE